MWQRLLVTLDGSPLAEHALPSATALARAFSAQLTLLHVQATDVPPDEDPPNLDAVAERLRADGIDVDTHVSHLPESYDVGDVIIDAAVDLRADLIVMATHGRGGLGRLIYGSVTDQVLRQAPLPVLLIPAAFDRRWPEARPVRILVPLDGSELAESILTPVQDLVRHLGAELIVLRVAETIELKLHGDECIRCRLARARGEEPDIEQVRAQRYIDDVAERLLDAGIAVEARLEFGGASATISQVARERDVDLIAMATHGRSGLARLVLGNVATETLQHSQIPVLVVRPETMRQARRGPAEATPARQEHVAPIRTRDVMSQPVVTVGLDATLEEIARLMLDREIGAVPVVDAEGHLAGIVTETNFSGEECFVPLSSFKLPQVFGQWMPKSGVEAIYQAARTMKASDVMSAPVMTTVEEEPISTVIRRMIERDLRRLPVVRGAVPVGMVTRHDLLRLMDQDSIRR